MTRLRWRGWLKFIVCVLVAYVVIEYIKQLTPSTYQWVTSLEELSAGDKKKQDLIDYIAANLRVVYKPEPEKNRRSITLINTGSRDIPANNWKIYYSDIPTLALEEEGEGLIVRHIDGWLHSMEPNTSFKTFLPGGATRTIVCSGQLSSRSYTFPRWYVAGPSRVLPRVINSTNSEDLEFVVDASGSNVSDRYDINAGVVDRTSVSNALETSINGSASHMEANNFIIPTQCHGEANNFIIPTPLSIVKNCDKQVRFDKSWRVVFDESLTAEAKYISETLQIPMTKISPEIDQNKAIILTCSDIKKLFIKLQQKQILMLEEAYTLSVEENQHIKIHGHACGRGGVFYGIQSLLSLLEGRSDDHVMLLVMRLIDAPRMSYRGLLLDVARGFRSKEDVMKTMDVMALYKLNKLHFHLTDDQGWRLEIPGLPELTQSGAKREHQSDVGGDKDSLYPYLGSHPTAVSFEYYTVDDYREILRHAKRLHIDVIPEVDMPGHAHAAILSMRVRRRRLLREGFGEFQASEFLISDPNDTSDYLGVNFQKDTVLNPCIDSTYAFVEHVIRAVIGMHKDVQPLKTFHIGGDEVSLDALTRSPICRKLIEHKPQLRGTHSLKTYFMKKVVNILSRLGVAVQAWEEGLGGDEENLPSRFSTWNHSSLTLNAWNTGKLVPFTFANAGYKVVLSDSAHLYLDHPQEADFDEPGLHWAKPWISTRRIFQYIPISNRLARNGSFMNKKMCSLYQMKTCIDMKRPENIVGMQASLWGELIRTMDQAEFMLYPRLLALAERAWHTASWELAVNHKDFNRLRLEDWTQFAETVGQKELRRLEKRNVHYRLPVPGAIATNNMILVNAEFPDLPIEYSLDKKVTWLPYNSTTKLERTARMNQIHLRTLSHDRKRKSRAVSLTLPKFNNATYTNSDSLLDNTNLIIN